MHILIGVLIAAFVVWFWAKGSAFAALFLTMGYLAIGGLLVLDKPSGGLMLSAVLLVIWSPLIMWRSFRKMYPRAI